MPSAPLHISLHFTSNICTTICFCVLLAGKPDAQEPPPSSFRQGGVDSPPPKVPSFDKRRFAEIADIVGISPKNRCFCALMREALFVRIRSIVRPQRPSKRIHFRAGSTMPWPAVLHDFDRFNSVNPEYQPMRRLVYSVYACASDSLYATQTMGGILLLSPDEELHKNDNVLLISYRPRKKLFHFEHRTISKNDDSKDVETGEVWPALRLFVGYKFGIRLPVKQPEPDAVPIRGDPT